MKKTLLITLLFAGILLYYVGAHDSAYRTAVGQKAPEIELKRGDSVLSLKKLRGKYVILSFWSSTDAATRRNTNIYTAWKRRHTTVPVELVAVNFDPSPKLFREIARRDSLIASDQYRVSGDTARAISDSYGLHRGLGAVLIDPDGTIIAHNPTDSVLSAIIRNRRGSHKLSDTSSSPDSLHLRHFLPATVIRIQ